MPVFGAKKRNRNQIQSRQFISLKVKILWCGTSILQDWREDSLGFHKDDNNDISRKMIVRGHLVIFPAHLNDPLTFARL